VDEGYIAFHSQEFNAAHSAPAMIRPGSRTVRRRHARAQ
jgi:hypothetical protein